MVEAQRPPHHQVSKHTTLHKNIIPLLPQRGAIIEDTPVEAQVVRMSPHQVLVVM
jgi:hypothetical protein